jgi:hypothetical protein
MALPDDVQVVSVDDHVIEHLDPSLCSAPDEDVERHSEAFAQLAEAGVTWTMIPGTSKEPKQTLGFLETFGELYIKKSTA